MYMYIYICIYIYIYIFSNIVLVPSYSFLSCRENLKNVYFTFLLAPVVGVETRIMCMYVRIYVCMLHVVQVPGNPLRSDVTCHLVAVRGTPNRHFDRTDLPKVYGSLSIHACKLKVVH